MGKTVLGGRAGGMPELVFEYILVKNKIATNIIEINIKESILLILDDLFINYLTFRCT